jgi:hypothetical protein
VPNRLLLLATFCCLTAWPLQAHHSFAIYDIDNAIERTGVLTSFVFANPHIRLALEVERDDRSTETWEIESMNPRRWDNFGHARNVATVPLLVGLAVAGAGIGLSSAGMQTAALESVGAAESGVAPGVFSTSRHLGSIVGSSLLAGILGLTEDGLEGFSLVFLMVVVTAFLSEVASLGLHDRPVEARVEANGSLHSRVDIAEPTHSNQHIRAVQCRTPH